MRVVMVTGQFYPIVGGAERQALKLAKALTRAGAEVLVLTGRWRGIRQGEETVEGIPVVRYCGRGLPLPGRDFGQGGTAACTLAAMLWRLRRDYDVVHAHQMLQHAWVAAVVGRRLGKPVVVKVGNTAERFDLRQLERSPRLLGRFMAHSMRRYVSRAITICTPGIAELRQAGFSEKQIVHIPNGVEFSAQGRQEDGSRRQPITVVFTGRFTAKKNISTLLQAMRQVLAAGRPARLLLLGDGPERSSLQRAARELGISQAVQFAGEVREVGPWLATADIFVLPSRVEGLSNALLEAMAHRLACVVTPVGGNTDLVKDGRSGLIVPVGDATALAQALLRLIDEPAYRRELAGEGWRRVARDYHIDRIAQRCLALYAELLAESSPATEERVPA